MENSTSVSLVHTSYMTLHLRPSHVVLQLELVGPLAASLNLVGWSDWRFLSTQGILQGSGPLQCYVRYQLSTLRYCATDIAICG